MAEYARTESTKTHRRRVESQRHQGNNYIIMIYLSLDSINKQDVYYVMR